MCRLLYSKYYTWYFFNKIKNKDTFFHEWFGLSTFVCNVCKKELINNITDLMIREQLCLELKNVDGILQCYEGHKRQPGLETKGFIYNLRPFEH
jgi:hypothetical protein